MNIEFIEVETKNGLEDWVIIDRGNNEFTSMSKARWDELESAKENGTIS